MPIEKISHAQFASEIAQRIRDTDPTADVAYGPIPSTAIEPQAGVFEGQNNRARKLSLLLTLANAEEFEGYEADLDGIVFNEGMTRSAGAASSASLLFRRASAPQSDALVPRGLPVATRDQGGRNITFVTTEARTLPAASAAAYFNIQSQQYELSVPAVSIVQGSVTRVGANQLTRPLRPLGEFDSVTNPEAAEGGRDAETNAELIERYLLGIIGQQVSTLAGLRRRVRALFASVAGLSIVHGSSPLLTRAATDAGAVDVWIKGASLLQIAENHSFLGLGQIIAVRSPPLVTVVSVSSGATTYTEGTDYEVVVDTSGVGRSPREETGIRFLPDGPSALPAVGDVVTVTYHFDNLVRALQTAFTEDDEVVVFGRDVLFRRSVAVPIVHDARLRVNAGVNATAVRAAVRQAVLTYINNSLALGAPIEGSDIQGVVRRITGVDNYIIDRLTRATVAVGTSDIVLAANEYPTLVSADYTLTSVAGV